MKKEDKHSKTKYKGKSKPWLHSLFESCPDQELVPSSERPGNKARSRRHRWINYGLAFLAGAGLLFLIWVILVNARIIYPNGQFSEFQRPELLRQGTFCELIIDEKWVLLPDPDDGQQEKSPPPAIDIDQLVFIEKLNKGRTRLIYADGRCEISPFKEVYEQLDQGEFCSLFQGLRHEGRVLEYINMLYIEGFDVVRCEGGERYRARLVPRALSPAHPKPRSFAA